MTFKHLIPCAVLTCGTLACSTPSPTAPSPAPSAAVALSLEAEAGGGQGDRMERASASGRLTVHLAPGQRREWTFKVSDPGSHYLVVVRYSNDETAESETLRTTVDGVAIGSFRAQDTGDDGAGWNAFVTDRAGGYDLRSGQHTLAVESSGGDGCIEIDVVTLTPAGAISR